MTNFPSNQTKSALVLLSMTLLFTMQGRAQLVTSVSTDKPVYLYGETITLVGIVTNQADTAVTVILPAQGPVTSASFDDVRLSWILAPLSLPFVFLPHMSYKSVLEIDGSRLGLPNKEGRHSLACSFSFLLNGNLFYRNDSTMISQPLFYGGQLLVEYSVHTPPLQIQSLRDSMNATVVSSDTGSEIVHARWQTSGFILDSLVAKFTGDSRLTRISADRTVSPPTILAQTNHKPVLVLRSPLYGGVPILNVPYKFRVGVYDPDGDTLIYTWKLDRAIVQSSRDSTYTLIYTNPLNFPHYLQCVFSDPGGLKDSTSWSFGDLAVPSEPGSIPGEYTLEQNYPNPFNPSTTISYGLPTASRITVRVFNALGQEVAMLVDEEKQAGVYQVRWTANVPSGIYFYRLQSGEYVETKKMIVLR